MRLRQRLLGLAAAAWLPVAPALAQASGERPSILTEIGFDQRLGESLPLDLPLRDEAGKAVRLGDYFKGRPVILTLVYYECPMLCTLTLNGLASALDVLSFDAGKEFEIVTVSFDPRETPELARAKKQTYLQRYKRPGAEAAWHFLTGDAESVKRLTQAVGFRYVWDDRTQQFAHPSGVMVATPDGRLARYLYGIEYAPKDLRFALIEAAEGKIGTPVDQAILFCYQYDPATGKYGAAIMRILRLAAIVTIAALGTFLTVMLRRERAARRATETNA